MATSLVFLESLYVSFDIAALQHVSERLLCEDRICPRKVRGTGFGFLEHSCSLGFSSVREHLTVYVCGY